MSHRCVGGWGSALDPTGGAHSLPQTCWLDFGKGKGWEGRGREGRKRKGKGKEGWNQHFFPL